MASEYAIENLPPMTRAKVVEMIGSRSSTRDISAWLKHRGHSVSHAAVARYIAGPYRAALETAAKVQIAESLTRGESETRAVTSAVTNAVLDAQPLLERSRELWEEIREGVAESKPQWVESDQHGPDGKPLKTYIAGDLKARAALLNVGRGIIETEAKLLGVGSFGQQATTVIDARTLLVMPSTVVQRNSDREDVIDVEAL